MQARKSSLALSMVKGAALMIVLLSALGAFAGTESVLLNFDSSNGSSPYCNGMVFDKGGNLYGATASGGADNAGVVFELTPPTEAGGSWTETLLYSFDPYSTTVKDGYYPCGSLAFDSKGNLYGTTLEGGTTGTGTVWELSPPTEGSTAWTETILYNFGAAGSGDGYLPYAGVTLATSAATTLYGTTACGGTGSVYDPYKCQGGSGTVYQLSYVKKTKTVAAHWTETILHNFSYTDGAFPEGGLLLHGKMLYGVANQGGTGPGTGGPAPDCGAAPPVAYGCGVVFKLQPGTGRWTESVLYNFGANANDAAKPGLMTPVMVGNNVYGTTIAGGPYENADYGGGTVWELVYSPTTQSYTEQVLYSLGTNANDGAQPYWQIVKGKKANTWYGATARGGEYDGSLGGTLFELTYNTKKKVWQETSVYQFTGGDDGATPGYNQLIADKSGNLYGMTDFGGDSYGVVFEFVP